MGTAARMAVHRIIIILIRTAAAAGWMGWMDEVVFELEWAINEEAGWDFRLGWWSTKRWKCLLSRGSSGVHAVDLALFLFDFMPNWFSNIYERHVDDAYMVIWCLYENILAIYADGYVLCFVMRYLVGRRLLWFGFLFDMIYSAYDLKMRWYLAIHTQQSSAFLGWELAWYFFTSTTSLGGNWPHVEFPVKSIVQPWRCRSINSPGHILQSKTLLPLAKKIATSTSNVGLGILTPRMSRSKSGKALSRRTYGRSTLTSISSTLSPTSSSLLFSSLLILLSSSPYTFIGHINTSIQSTTPQSLIIHPHYINVPESKTRDPTLRSNKPTKHAAKHAFQRRNHNPSHPDRKLRHIINPRPPWIPELQSSEEWDVSSFHIQQSSQEIFRLEDQQFSSLRLAWYSLHWNEHVETTTTLFGMPVHSASSNVQIFHAEQLPSEKMVWDCHSVSSASHFGFFLSGYTV